MAILSQNVGMSSEAFDVIRCHLMSSDVKIRHRMTFHDSYLPVKSSQKCFLYKSDESSPFYEQLSIINTYSKSDFLIILPDHISFLGKL